MNIVRTFAAKVHNYLGNCAASQQLSALKSCGDFVTFRQGVKVRSPENISIGHHCDIGEYSVLMGAGGITIGNHCVIAPGTYILTRNHIIDDRREFYSRVTDKPIRIGDHVWIGAGAIIIPGVSVGDHAVVGAGAVVTKDVSPRTTVAGVPAKPLS